MSNIEIPKGYKQTELGVIPDDWEVKELGDISKIIMGQSPKSVYYNKKGIGLPLVQGNADIENRRTIIRNFTSNITKKCNKGSIIMTVRAPVGEIAKSNFDCCIGRGVCSLEYKNEYLYHKLLLLENHWEKLSRGSTFDSVNSKEVKEILLSIPSDPKEQEAIANVLSNTDELIQALEKLIEKKKKIKEGIMQQLLTGKKRLEGFNDEWEEKKLGDIGICLRGVSYNGSNDLYDYENVNSKILLRSNNIKNNKLMYKDVQYVKKKRVNELQELINNDILICMANGSKELVGKYALCENISKNYTFGAFMGCYRIQSENYSKIFISYLFNTKTYRNSIDLELSGSSINNLKPSDIEGIKFSLPKSLKEQEAIANILSDMDSEITTLNQKLNKYKQIKEGMMQQLLTGKIRLNQTLVKSNHFLVNFINK